MPIAYVVQRLHCRRPSFWGSLFWLGDARCHRAIPMARPARYGPHAPRVIVSMASVAMTHARVAVTRARLRSKAVARTARAKRSSREPSPQPNVWRALALRKACVPWIRLPIHVSSEPIARLDFASITIVAIKARAHPWIPVFRPHAARVHARMEFAPVNARE